MAQSALAAFNWKDILAKISWNGKIVICIVIYAHVQQVRHTALKGIALDMVHVKHHVHLKQMQQMQHV